MATRPKPFNWNGEFSDAAEWSKCYIKFLNNRMNIFLISIFFYLSANAEDNVTALMKLPRNFDKKWNLFLKGIFCCAKG